ncbi:MAG: DUF2791 family P-loop domain-containing protein [Anaerolineaceae bacterium]|jgi:hypothetical protein
MFESLNLRDWPFMVVPDAQFARIWAGRKQSKQQLERLLLKLQYSPKSSLYLFWANFGMGKTHTLYHIQHQCQNTQGKLVPVYVSMPSKPKGFLDLYRAIIQALPYDYIGDQFVRVGALSPKGVAFHTYFEKVPGVVNALLAIRNADIERSSIALQWLSAQPGLSASDLRQIGIRNQIKNPDDAITLLSALTKLVNLGDKNRKLLILVDEYQKIGELNPRVRNDTNNGLHKYFNQHPTGLSIILSFSFGTKDNLPYHLSKELKDRAEPETISLDVLKKDEAIEFIRDLLAQFHISEDGRWAFPFSPEAVVLLVNHLTKKSGTTPRRLMKYMNHILLEVIAESGGNLASDIKANEISRILNNPDLNVLDVEDEQL